MARKQFNTWVIHTDRPGFKIVVNDLDPEYVKLKEMAKAGLLTATTSNPKPHAAADALDWSPERMDLITTFEADNQGRFICDSEEEAKLVIKELNKCYGGIAKVCMTPEEYSTWRGVKFTLDPNSPTISFEEKKTPPKK